MTHNVVPPPDRTMFDADKPAVLNVVNHTGGAVSDADAAKWADANERENTGDAWAQNHMRLDIIQSGVFGTPGLSGDDALVQEWLTKGATGFRPDGKIMVSKVTIATVSGDLRFASAAPATYAVVVTYSSVPSQLAVFADGHTEVAWPGSSNLTTAYYGELRDDPVIGPVWWQMDGRTLPAGASY